MTHQQNRRRTGKVSEVFNSKRVSELSLQFFTLVELLVVIAIIAILASLMLPALNSARATANGLSCLSQMRQCGLAMQGYMSDYNGWVPNALNGSNYWQNWSWYMLNGKYTTKETMFCPTARSTWANYYQTYGLTQDCYISFRRLDSTKNPSNYVLFCDTSKDFNFRSQAPNFWKNETSWDKSYLCLRHQNKGNLVFLDGHGEGVRAKDAKTYGFKIWHML